MPRFFATSLLGAAVLASGCSGPRPFSDKDCDLTSFVWIDQIFSTHRNLFLSDVAVTVHDVIPRPDSTEVQQITYIDPDRVTTADMISNGTYRVCLKAVSPLVGLREDAYSINGNTLWRRGQPTYTLVDIRAATIEEVDQAVDEARNQLR